MISAYDICGFLTLESGLLGFGGLGHPLSLATWSPLQFAHCGVSLPLMSLHSVAL